MWCSCNRGGLVLIWTGVGVGVDPPRTKAITLDRKFEIIIKIGQLPIQIIIVDTGDIEIPPQKVFWVRTHGRAYHRGSVFKGATTARCVREKRPCEATACRASKTIGFNTIG